MSAKMRKHRWLIAVGIVLLLGAAGIVYWGDLLPRREIEDGDYPLEAVSVFTEDKASNIRDLALGQQGWWKASLEQDVIWVAEDTQWKTVPDPEAKAYPKLKSARPLYGSILFGRGRPDWSKGEPYLFVVDESAATGTGYDRLYFDTNHDLDLTNDGIQTKLTDPPWPSHGYHSWGNSTAFEPLLVSFDFGPEHGEQSVEILPRLQIAENRPMIYFVRTEARKGRIQIGRHRFDAVLSQPQAIQGRYDASSTELHLTTVGLQPRSLSHRWWSEERLASFRLVDGKLYSLSVTPPGDMLMVRRYRGDLGLLRVEAGKREIGPVSVRGAIYSKTTAAPVGTLPHVEGELEPVIECEVPVGDYAVEQLRFSFGKLQFWGSENYHLDGKQQGALAKEDRSMPIQIRKDQPFVLDFSTKPEVMFASPAKEQSFKPSDEVKVAAVLVDPKSNTMIRGMNDTSRKTKRTVGEQTVEVDLSLDPLVAIVDSSGKKVAEGTMPFG